MDMRIRDCGPYSSRNTSKGDIIRGAARLFGALREGTPLEDVHRSCLEGDLLPLASRNSRRFLWTRLQHYYLSPEIDWIRSDFFYALQVGERSHEFVSLLYLHFALRDRVTYDCVTQVIWAKWNDQNCSVSVEDLVSFLENAADEQPQITRWTEQSRRKVAQSILAALRDFGLLEGVIKKRIVKPAIPLTTARHILRILTSEGVRGMDILRHDTWKLYLCREYEVADLLARLAQDHVIRYERAGNTVVLQTPPEWEAEQ